MLTNILTAWALAADDAFGGSLDDSDEPAGPPYAYLASAPTRGGRRSSSGVRYLYRSAGDYWQVRLPIVDGRNLTKVFRDRAAALAWLYEMTGIQEGSNA